MRISRTRGVIIGALADWFAIQPMAASVLWTLYKERSPLTASKIGRLTGCSPHSIAAYAVHIRKALDGGIPHNASGSRVGATIPIYQLTATGRNQVRTAIEQLQTEIDRERSAEVKPHLALVSSVAYRPTRPRGSQPC